ncbi:MAG: choice-of-anchor L domain-containing protein [Flavobacteriales bacterium]|nr:choice-of-anchor L domain-containing protein [Flavobacteriales bacterium]
MKYFLGIIMLVLMGLTAGTASAQLVVDNTLTPTQMVEDILLGPGVTASNISFTGVGGQSGYFNGVNSNIGISEGVILSSGNVTTAIGPNNDPGAGNDVGPIGPSGDSDLDLLSGVNTFDAAILEFDFVPTGDSIDFSYVFGSEEYNEYVCGTVNDVFGFFLSGPGFAGPYTNGAVNIALVPGTNTPVSINTVNNGTAGFSGTAATCAALDPNWTSYNVYFNDNAGGTSVQYDGFTVVLKAKAAVQCGETYHIKLAIADGGDGIFDSGVFLEARSFRSNIVEVAIETASGSVEEGGGWIVENCTPAVINFTRPAENADTLLAVPIFTSGSAINGVDYSGVPDTVFFAVGDTSISVEIQALQDGLTEVGDSIVITVYTISLCGDTIISTGTIQIYDLGPAFPAFAPDDFVWCSADSAMLDASALMGNPGYTYQWSNGAIGESIWVNPNSDTTFIVQATDACGTLSLPDTVNIDYVVMSLQLSNDVTLSCPGDNAVLTAIATGGVPSYSYAWSSGQSSTTITVQPTQTTDYVISVTDNCPAGSTVRDTITVTVLPYTPVSVSVQDTSVLCPGDLVSISADVANGTSPFDFSWSDGTSGSSTTTNPNTTIELILTVTDNCGSVATDTATVSVPVYNPLTATILNSDLLLSDTVTVCELWSDTLASAVSGGLAPYSYNWSGTLIESSLTNDSAVVSVPYELSPDSAIIGLYTLTVVDQCMEEVMAEVVVEGISCDIIQPGIFNPNSTFVGATDICGNAPQNNVFNLPCLELYPGNTMTIWDRWGRKCYKTDEYHLNPWDGGNKSEGTYFYVCELPNGKEPVKGYFQIVR